MVWGTPMHAMIRNAPPQAGQVPMAMLNTRFRRWPNPWRRGVRPESAVLETSWCNAGLAYRAWPASPSQGLLGANTPWKRVSLSRGLGNKAATRAMTSSGLAYKFGAHVQMPKRVTHAPSPRLVSAREHQQKCQDVAAPNRHRHSHLEVRQWHTGTRLPAVLPRYCR